MGKTGVPNYMRKQFIPSQNVFARIIFWYHQMLPTSCREGTIIFWSAPTKLQREHVQLNGPPDHGQAMLPLCHFHDAKFVARITGFVILCHCHECTAPRGGDSTAGHTCTPASSWPLLSVKVERGEAAIEQDPSTPGKPVYYLVSGTIRSPTTNAARNRESKAPMPSATMDDQL